VYRFPFRTALKTANLDLLVAARRRVADLKHTFAPDLSHISPSGPSFFFHLHTRTAHPAPVLITLRGEISAMGMAAHGALFSRLLRSASWVVGVSASVLDQARQLLPEIATHSSVIYNSQEPPSLSPTPLPTESPRLLCLGRLVSEKGFDLALTAFAAVVKRFPHVRLFIAGDGAEHTALERQAAQLGIRQALDFLDWVAPDAVPSLLNSVFLVLMPSRTEGLPLVAVEAALMARPVVATRAGGLPEVIVHRQTGLLVEKEDSRGLAEAITFLLEHPEIAIRMGHAARQHAMETFSPERCVDAYDLLYQKLIREPSG
jgi:glycogen synthase